LFTDPTRKGLLKFQTEIPRFESLSLRYPGRSRIYELAETHSTVGWEPKARPLDIEKFDLFARYHIALAVHFVVNVQRFLALRRGAPL